jgi:hypothetical protein
MKARILDRFETVIVCIMGIVVIVGCAYDWGYEKGWKDGFANCDNKIDGIDSLQTRVQSQIKILDSLLWASFREVK